VRGSEKDSRSYEASSALELLHGLLDAVPVVQLYQLQHGAHVRPLTELSHLLAGVLDVGVQPVVVPHATLGHMAGSRWWRGEVRILAANLQHTRALGVGGIQHSGVRSRRGTEPDVDEAHAVCDDVAVPALVVLHAGVAQAGVVGTVAASARVNRYPGGSGVARYSFGHYGCWYGGLS